MEIEAKFVVLTQALEDRLQSDSSLAGFELGPGAEHDLHDTYYDTADRALLTAGYAYRRRACGARTVSTLKGLGSAADGCIHRREEIEVAEPSEGSPDASPIDDELRALGVHAPLNPLFELRQRRLDRPVWMEGRRIGTLSLDRIRFSGPEGSIPFTELELEWTDPAPGAALDAALERLRGLKGLTPEPISKFSRGWVLAEGCARMRAVGAYALRPDDTLAQAARKIIVPLSHKLLVHEFGTYRGADIEALHQMRVTARRMRTAVRIFRPYLDGSSESGQAVKRLAKGLKKLTRVMGPVRDQDVFREDVTAYLQNLDRAERPDLRALQQAWNEAYGPARNALADYLESEKHARLKSNLTTELETALTAPAAQTPVLAVLPGIIQTRLQAIRRWAYGAETSGAPLDAQHHLRLEIKRLRYTLEFFQPLLTSEVEGIIEQLIALQDHLGDLKDGAFACEHGEAVRYWQRWWVPRQPDTLWGSPEAVKERDAVPYFEVRRARMDRLRADLPQRWTETSPSIFDTLMTVAGASTDEASAFSS